MNKRIPLEKDEQVSLIQWLDIKHIDYFAIPNGGSRHKLEAINLKAQGVKPGASDIVVFLPTKILFIELKRRKKVLKNGKLSTAHTKTSDEQIKFIEMVNKLPYAQGKVCYGWEDAREFVEMHRHPDYGISMMLERSRV